MAGTTVLEPAASAVTVRDTMLEVMKSFCDFTHVGRKPGMELPGVDVVKIAQGYGMAAQEVDRPEDLEPVFKQAFASPGRLVSANVAKAGHTCMGMDQSVNPPNYG